MDELRWKEDTVYGFDFVVERAAKDEDHLHSIALVKDITKDDKMKDVEKWVKIAHSVRK